MTGGPEVAELNRVLVTGAGGMIGRAVVDEWHACGVTVTALDRVVPVGLDADRVVAGDAGDPAAVADAMADADAVIHLAALPSPGHGTPLEVFSGNTRATFVVLEEAGRRGVRRCAYSSSYSVTGLPWATGAAHPAYLPVDEDLPPLVEDAYGLSKLVDELTAAMMAHRHGMAVVALRLPFVTDERRRRQRLAATLADPLVGSAEMWAYLDVRDAARALRLAVTVPLVGFHVMLVAAPEVLAPYATEDLIARYHPGSPVHRPLPGRTLPIDLTRARDRLGFTAQHRVEFDVRPLPVQRSQAAV